MTTNQHYRGSSIVKAVRCGLLSSPVVAGLACIALAGVPLDATAQQAQNATADTDQLVEVVVTAERRAENVQNVPIAVSAFTSDAMQSRNITSIQALGNLTPGVNLDAGAPFSGDHSVLSASIRGIGQDDFAFNLNPGVGVYLDGVFLARTIGANQNLLDVDRIEILKGPQGSLFGANTIGGAISVVTHTPGDETRFIATATGGSFDRRDFGFTADIPIIKGVLLSSISVSSEEQTGWMKVVPYPSNSPYAQVPLTFDSLHSYPQAGYDTNDNYDGKGLQVIRGKLLWNASDKMTWTLGLDWSHEDTTALGYQVLGAYNGAGATFTSLYNTCISNNAATLPSSAQPPIFQALCSAAARSCSRAGLHRCTPAARSRLRRWPGGLHSTISIPAACLTSARASPRLWVGSSVALRSTPATSTPLTPGTHRILPSTTCTVVR